MKNFKFLFGAFCALGMMACSSSDDVAEGGGEAPEGGRNLYLSVNVMSANEGTRATETGEPGEGDDASSKYEKGEGAENKITTAYFYFFDADGNAANVVKQNGKYVNYYASPTDDADTDMPNVEKLLTATVVIDTKKGDLIPDKLVAVLNAGEVLTKEDGTGMNLSELSEIVKDYRISETAATGFVMSSSVYADGNNVKKMEVDNIQGYFKDNATSAKDTPVDIYVERVLAKVSVGTTISTDDDITLDDGTKLYYTGQTSDKSDAGQKSLYVKFLGWNVATETKTSYLFKNINGAWTDSDLGIVNWTWPNYYRSFWAMNPKDVGYDYKDFNETKALKVGSVGSDGYVVYGTEKDNINYTYIQENASPYDKDGSAQAPSNPTKIVVASQLVDKDGKAVTLAEWRGLRSTKDGVLKTMANFSGVYYQKDDDTRALITPDMIKFAKDKPYAVLTDEAAKDYTFYLSSGATETANVDAVNNQLKELGEAKVWEDGRTYYYTDIRHLGNITPATETDPVKNSAGAYGVVRNHSYQVVLTSVTGLGTPVYNPDEFIIPETPEEEESYLAARIKVLSWRVVKSTVDLK